MEKFIYLAGGCFWGVQSFFSRMSGVVATTAGYANGALVDHVSYEEVRKGGTSFKEAVEVVYDPSLLPLTILLDAFFKVIDPTAVARQGSDVGSQYQSGVYFRDEESGEIVLSFFERKRREIGPSLAVECQALTNFIKAEEYHQDYLKKHPGFYCHIPFSRMDAILLEVKYDILALRVREAGALAKEMQGKIHVTRKDDGSPVTEADLSISHSILSVVKRLFPEADIISEEERTTLHSGAPLTFVLDPIDGTDVYSQGFPSFAVALAVLGADRKPRGAMISAPRFGVATEELFVRLDPGGKLLVGGKEFHRSGNKDKPAQITMGSDALRHMEPRENSIKLRCLGSSILHLLSPVLFPLIDGCVETSGYIWDVAASHAVLLHEGMDIVHADGSPFRYDDRLFSGKNYIPPIYAGTKACTDTLRSIFRLGSD